ncbi:MAG: response regulator transcription factor [Hyphomicrobiaceae bacterium]|nr:response regulator transcription factor [Hyphomicrobiaceae bacterium]MCC0010035.1 response regulator transcription factor [Hyphomicrobiaceae bacterium]
MNDRGAVLVVDDDAAARESLHWLLESVGLEVLCFSSADEFLAKYSGEPGCLIIDVRMPGMSGLELQREVQKRDWRLPIIMVTGHGDVPMAVRAMRAGAIDFLQKPYDDQMLLERTEQALKMARATWDEWNQEKEIKSRFAQLTRREREIAMCVGAGKPNKLIAHELGLSCKTIEAYRANMMNKMSASSVVHLVHMLTKIDVQDEQYDAVQHSKASV